MKNIFFYSFPQDDRVLKLWQYLTDIWRQTSDRLAWVRSCDFPRWTSKQLCHCSKVRGEQRSSCSDSSLRTQVRDWFCNFSMGTGWGVGGLGGRNRKPSLCIWRNRNISGGNAEKTTSGWWRRFQMSVFVPRFFIAGNFLFPFPVTIWQK